MTKYAFSDSKTKHKTYTTEDYYVFEGGRYTLLSGGSGATYKYVMPSIGLGVGELEGFTKDNTVVLSLQYQLGDATAMDNVWYNVAEYQYIDGTMLSFAYYKINGSTNSIDIVVGVQKDLPKTLVKIRAVLMKL